jgi:hypothetical protein
MASVRNEPRRRANAAGTACEKAAMTAAPDRERRARRKIEALHAFTKASESSATRPCRSRSRGRSTSRPRQWIHAGDEGWPLHPVLMVWAHTSSVTGRKRRWDSRAPDARFLTDTADPLVRAGRRIPGPSSFPTLESARVDILAPAEQRSEERNLGLGWRCPVDRTRNRAHLGLPGTASRFFASQAGQMAMSLMAPFYGGRAAAGRLRGCGAAVRGAGHARLQVAAGAAAVQGYGAAHARLQVGSGVLRAAAV